MNLFFEKVYYEKNQQMTKKHEKFPRGQKVYSHLYSEHSGPCTKKQLLPLGNHPDCVVLSKSRVLTITPYIYIYMYWIDKLNNQNYRLCKTCEIFNLSKVHNYENEYVSCLCLFLL